MTKRLQVGKRPLCSEQSALPLMPLLKGSSGEICDQNPKIELQIHAHKHICKKYPFVTASLTVDNKTK